MYASYVILMCVSCIIAVDSVIKAPSLELQLPLQDTSPTLCPPGMAYYNETEKCHILEGSTPCGKNMVFLIDERNPEYGACACKFGRKSDCLAKPVAFWNEPKGCYPLYEQGPCKQSEWLVPDGDTQLKCVNMECNVNIPSEATMPSPSFAFATNGTCYRTFEQAYCRANELVVFLGNSYEPKCIPRKNVLEPCYPLELLVASLQGPKV